MKRGSMAFYVLRTSLPAEQIDTAGDRAGLQEPWPRWSGRSAA